jgi:SAM-dependent methyltransferase
MKLSWSVTKKHSMEFIRLGNAIRMNDTKLIRKLIPPTSGLVLDIGSHDAFWSLRITKKMKARVIYSDIDLNALTIAKSRGLTVVCADASALPFRSEVFDGIFSVSVYQLLSNVHEAFSDAFRSLKTNGYFCYCVDSFTGKGYDDDEWKDSHSKREGVVTFFSKNFSQTYLNKAGFEVTHQFCVLGNGWWRLIKILPRIGSFVLFFWPIFYPLVHFAYKSQYETGQKLFALASK